MVSDKSSLRDLPLDLHLSTPLPSDDELEEELRPKTDESLSEELLPLRVFCFFLLLFVSFLPDLFFFLSFFFF